MAIDLIDDRRSAACCVLAVIPPLADGTIRSGDRWHVSPIYRGRVTDTEALPILERIAQAIAMQVATVTEDNGYNTTINDVVRPTRTGPITPADRLAVLVQEPPTIEPAPAGYAGWVVPFELDLYVVASDADTGAIETDITTVCSDVAAAIMADPTWGGLALDTDLDEPVIYPSGKSSIAGATLRLLVSFRTLRNDPYSDGGFASPAATAFTVSEDATLPILERIADAVAQQLESVTAANGYNSTVSDVVRPNRAGPVTEADALVVMSLADPEPVDEAVAGYAEWRAVFLIDLYAIASDTATAAIDTTINIFRADVERALLADPTWDGHAIDSEIESPTDWMAEDGSVEGVTVRLAVNYRTPETDPFSLN